MSPRRMTFPAGGALRRGRAANGALSPGNTQARRRRQMDDLVTPTRRARVSASARQRVSTTATGALLRSVLPAPSTTVPTIVAVTLWCAARARLIARTELAADPELDGRGGGRRGQRRHRGHGRAGPPVIRIVAVALWMQATEQVTVATSLRLAIDCGETAVADTVASAGSSVFAVAVRFATLSWPSPEASS